MHNEDGKRLPDIPMGKKVHPGFWLYVARTTLLLHMVLVQSYNNAVEDPVTGRRKAKIAMNVNPN